MNALIDTGTDQVQATLSDGVGTVILNRPERRNALSTAMLAGVGRVLKRFDDDHDVGCIVITGAGGAFCSGGDVHDFEARSREAAPGADGVDPLLVARQLQDQRSTVGRVYHAAKPVIASLPGAAAGAGLGLALAADLRIGCDRTLMVTAFASVGLSGDYGVAWFLHHLVGPAKARELLFLSPRLDASECLRLGLLDRLCDASDLEAETSELGQRLANGPRAAVRLMKQNLLEAPSVSLDASMEAEVPRHKSCTLTDNHREGVAALSERRAPIFNRAQRA
jgi:2-(1,2-epoxy-1,2-dihydrophenyl)acetyl-CoA isomerase